MADEQKQEEKTEVVNVPIVNPFDESNWKETPPTVVEKVEEKVEDKKPEIVETKKEDEDEILDEDELYKREFGKDKASFKAEYDELLKFRKEQPKEELKFENDESRNVYEYVKDPTKRKELRKFLQTQEDLDSLTTGEVNKDNAADIIKLKMQVSNKLLTKDDIEFQYRQEFVAPKEPVQKATEDDEDFKERHEEWKEKVSIIEQKKIVAAKMAIPELEKLKTQLTLPDIIKKEDVDPKLTPEAQQKELERLEGIRNQYLKVLESDYSKFNGYEVKAKDGEVEIPVAYIVTDQQKAALKDELKDFDVDGFISERWFTKEGSPNISQMMEDIHLLRNKGDIFQKIANDAASKRLVQHLGEKSKIDVNGKKSDGTFSPNGQQNDQQKMAEFFLSQS